MEPTHDPCSDLRSFGQLLLTGVLATALSGCTAPGASTSPSGTWAPITAEEASLVLYAPGLSSPRVSFTRMVDGFKIFELGHWRPATSAFPEAKIIVFRFSSMAPSGMTFIHEPPLEARIKGSFGGESIETKSAQKFRNALGSLEYMLFTRDGATQCVFMRQFGDTYSDQRDYFSDGSTGHGDIMIRGYYCLAPTQQLSQSTLERFLGGIGLKGFGVPVEPADLALTATSVAASAAAGALRRSTRSGAYPYRVKFTSMVLRSSGGQELADDLSEISLDQGRFFVYVGWAGLSKHEHHSELRVFDGEGNQVKASDYTFTPTSERWNTWWSYVIDPDVDRPGTWKFLVKLDGEDLVEKTLPVRSVASTSPRSGMSAASRDAAFRHYRLFDEGSEYKIFVQAQEGAWAWRVRESFHAARLEAMQACHRRRAAGQTAGCRVYAAGNEVVWNMSESERKKVIEKYKH